jgi:4-hydroxy-3-polyprenylbenzoate decarboxylase
MEGARAIWEELGLPALSARGPWHGYTLGDWTRTWERFAQRATAGDWEQNGVETLARQRSDVTPETPVRKVEKLD